MDACCRCELSGSQSACDHGGLRGVCSGEPWRTAAAAIHYGVFVVFLVAIVVSACEEVCVDVAGALGSRLRGDHFTPSDYYWGGGGYGCTVVYEGIG